MATQPSEVATPEVVESVTLPKNPKCAACQKAKEEASRMRTDIFQ